MSVRDKVFVLSVIGLVGVVLYIVFDANPILAYFYYGHLDSFIFLTSLLVCLVTSCWIMGAIAGAFISLVFVFPVLIGSKTQVVITGFAVLTIGEYLLASLIIIFAGCLLGYICNLIVSVIRNYGILKQEGRSES